MVLNVERKEGNFDSVATVNAYEVVTLQIVRIRFWVTRGREFRCWAREEASTTRGTLADNA